MRLGCFLPILAIGFLGVGGQGLYVGLTNRKLNTMTYQQFLEKKPTSGWIEVSDARLNLLSAIRESNRITGTIKQVYIPVRSSAKSKGEDEGEDESEGDKEIHLLLLTQDEAILKTLKNLDAATGAGGGLLGTLQRRVEANQQKQKADTEKHTEDTKVQNALRFLVENQDNVVITRPVRGLLKFGIESTSHGERLKIQGLDPKIVPDFAVLEDGAEPEIAGSVFMILVGLLLAAFLFVRAARAKPVTPPAARSPGEAAPPAGPPS
jgi:hypothetical protein